jgi:hypothetical protein
LCIQFSISQETVVITRRVILTSKRICFCNPFYKENTWLNCKLHRLVGSWEGSSSKWKSFVFTIQNLVTRRSDGLEFTFGLQNMQGALVIWWHWYWLDCTYVCGVLTVMSTHQ